LKGCPPYRVVGAGIWVMRKMFGIKVKINIEKKLIISN